MTLAFDQCNLARLALSLKSEAVACALLTIAAAGWMVVHQTL